ncbi:MAG: hypothetical protein Kow00109_25600 [Acidobacteriota bacterium]
MKGLFNFVPLVVLGASVWAGPADPAVDQILQEYFKIHKALASDSTQGIDPAAKRIQELATSAKAPAAEVQSLLAQIRAAAEKIQGKPLDQAREVFFELSRPLLVYLNSHHANKAAYYRYFCPMAKKGWIQAEKGTKNPYYGSSMLTCGQLIE